MLTRKQVIESMRKVVGDNPHATRVGLYRENKEAHCLVAKVVEDLLGVRGLNALRENFRITDITNIQAIEKIAKDGVEPGVFNILDAAQSEQDDGREWKGALAVAEDAYEVYEETA